MNFSHFRAWRLALSLLSGFALALAFPNYNLPLLGWVSVAGLLYASINAATGEAALCGFLYGAAYYGLSVPWIYTVVQQFGPLPVWEASGVFALFVTAMSVFSTIFAAVVAWIARRSVTLALIASPFVWVAMDLAKNAFPAPNVCFPWDILGYTAAGNLALLQIVSVTGIWGLSLLVAAYNALLVGPLGAPAGHAAAQRDVAALGWRITVILVGCVAIRRPLRAAGARRPHGSSGANRPAASPGLSGKLERLARRGLGPTGRTFPSPAGLSTTPSRTSPA